MEVGFLSTTLQQFRGADRLQWKFVSCMPAFFTLIFGLMDWESKFVTLFVQWMTWQLQSSYLVTLNYTDRLSPDYRFHNDIFAVTGSTRSRSCWFAIILKLTKIMKCHISRLTVLLSFIDTTIRQQLCISYPMRKNAIIAVRTWDVFRRHASHISVEW